MEELIIKLLIGLGGPGVMAGVMFYLLRVHMQTSREQTKEAQEQMCERIAEQGHRIAQVEEGHKQCEAERVKQADMILDLLKGRTTGRRKR
jgi:hypothetical protein